MRIHGLVAAAHTPFTARGELNLAIVERQFEHFVRDGLVGAFVGGTTGECASLTVLERLALNERWCDVAKGSDFKVIVHVGANSVEDSKTLAADAAKYNAAGVAALAPSYFKPASAADLAAGLAMIAAACPETPFYYYDIPSLTGVTFPAAVVLEHLSKQAPNLNGAKFTNIDLASYQQCLHLHSGKYDMPFGCDDALLAALSLGAVGAVGVSYNFTAPVFRRVMKCFENNEIAAAREHQWHGTRLISELIPHGYISAGKVIMSALGVDVGPARWPLPRYSPPQEKTIRELWAKFANVIR